MTTFSPTTTKYPPSLYSERGYGGTEGIRQKTRHALETTSACPLCIATTKCSVQKQPFNRLSDQHSLLQALQPLKNLGGKPVTPKCSFNSPFSFMSRLCVPMTIQHVITTRMAGEILFQLLCSFIRLKPYTKGVSASGHPFALS